MYHDVRFQYIQDLHTPGFTERQVLVYHAHMGIG